jgi:hypothetical protein
VELAASMVNTKTTTVATTTPSPMYIHHMGHLDWSFAADEDVWAGKSYTIMVQRHH